MSRSHDPSPGASGVARRLRYASLTAVLVLAVLGCVVLANVLGDHFSRRFDVTATGEHRLAPRSLKILASLQGSYEVIVAADMSQLDRRAKQDAKDVLERYRQPAGKGGSLAYREIDIASATGLAQYAQLLRDLSKDDASTLADERKRVETAARNAAALSVELNSTFAPGITSFLATISSTSPQATALLGTLQQSSATLPAALRTAMPAITGLPPLMDRTIEGVAVPSLVQAVNRLTPPLQDLSRLLLSIEADLRQLADAHPPVAPQAKLVADGVRTRREQFDVVLDSLSRVKFPDTLLVAESLSKSAAVLVKGPKRTDTRPSIISVPFEQIFPSREALERSELASADLRRRSEDLITSALAILVNPAPPIVVMTTAEPLIAARQGKLLETVSQRLRRGGADVVSWDLLLNPDPPTLTKIDPTRTRPIVYAVRMPDESQGRDSLSGKTGLERSRLIGAAAARLAADGAAMLISIGPSIVPVAKEPDPADGVLGLFGLSARSDYVLVGQATIPGGGTQVLTALDANIPASQHPISASIRGLPTHMPWATSLRIIDSTACKASILLDFPPLPNVWAERDWLATKVAQNDPSRQSKPLSFDETSDIRDGPWNLAIAAERPHSGTPPQRLIAVASNEWLIDSVVQRSQSVDGREVDTSPGNLQFMESSIYWLAGQDSLIATDASSRQIAIVGPLSPSRLTAIRAVLMVGLPIATLIIAFFYRIARG